MADKKKVNPTSISPAASKLLNQLATNKKEILKTQFGMGRDLDNSEFLSNANEISATIRDTFSSILGTNSVSGEETNQILRLSMANKSANEKNGQEKKKNLDDLKKSISSMNNSYMLQMINSRQQTKRQLYASYELLLTMIPKMQLAVNTFVNSIISPDDYTKSSLNIDFDSSAIPTEKIDSIKKSLEALSVTYGIEKNLKNDIKDYLIKGELFFAVLSMNDDIKKMLTEDVNNTSPIEYTAVKGFDDTVLTENATTYFNEDKTIFDSGIELFTEGKDAPKKSKFQEELNYIIKNGFVIADSSKFLHEDMRVDNEIIQNTLLNSNVSKEDNDAVDGFKFSEDSAILRKLVPENVVELKYNDKIYGYVYLDVIEAEIPKMNSGGEQNINITSNSPLGTVLYSGNDIPATTEGMISPGADGSMGAADARLMFIASVFANRLSATENISILKKDEGLKNAIFYSLKTKEILKKNKVRATFFRTDEVVHINRGSSIFDNILFFAKMYIATLITILMQNIIRGADHRVYNVEVGLENDVSNVINSVIKDIKSKEITGIQNMDVFSILNVVGTFNDFFMPVVDGEKAVTMETLDGLANKSLDDDFLNWLSNNIFSGMGLPSAYLTEVENVDFAKTLSMQNSRFIRDIVAEQSILGYGYSDMLQKLYKVEFVNPNKSTSTGDDGREKNSNGLTAEEAKEAAEKSNILSIVNINGIKIRFPSPMSLNMTNLADQISNLNTVLDPLIDLIDWNGREKEIGVGMVKMEMYKKFITSFDWDTFDDTVSRVKKDLNKKLLRDIIQAKREGLLPSGDDNNMPDDNVEDDLPADKDTPDDAAGEDELPEE